MSTLNWIELILGWFLVGVFSAMYFKVRKGRLEDAERYMREVTELQTEIWQKVRDFEALDKGMDEQREAYEQEYLTKDEIIESQRNMIAQLHDDNGSMYEVVSFHNVNCLPVLTHIREKAQKELDEKYPEQKMEIKNYTP